MSINSSKTILPVITGIVVATTVTALSTYYYWLLVKPRRRSLGKKGITIRSLKDLESFGSSGIRSSVVRAIVGPFVTSLQVISPGYPLELPLGIGYLSSLKEVDLSRNNLSSIPEPIFNLNFLKILNLSSNNITSVSSKIGSLVYLENLDLGKNQIRSIPSAIGCLRQLRFLNLMSNKLESLPQEIGNLKLLFRLGLKSNSLKVLPDSIGDMEGLVELFLTDNKLESLPSAMAKLTKLFKLQASFNCLKSLPEEMGSLPNLELFRIAVNQVPAVPSSFVGLDRLAWFSLAGNPACAPHPPPQREIVHISISELQIGQQLGDGASGVVYLADWRGRQVAFKQFRSEASPDGHCSDEIAVTCALDHPSLIKVLAIVDVPRGLVMELLPGRAMADKPNFDSLLRCRWSRGAKFESSFVLKVASRVAQALSHLHSLGICHGDVYAHNVVASEAGEAVLCDYGASFCYDPSTGAVFEAQEVRAFGLFLRDLVQRMVWLSASGGEEVKRRLETLVHSCVDLPARTRLGFADISRVLASISSEQGG